MAELLLGVSQSSLLLQPSKFRFYTHASPSRPLHLQQQHHFLISSSNQKCHFRPIVAASSDSVASTIITDNVDLSTQGIDIEPDTGGGGDRYGVIGGGGEGGRGGDDYSGGGGGGKNEGEGHSGDKKKMGLSMSQKLTLGYAALVGMGGLMGYLKGGSQKSLLAGGLSASVLFYVSSNLPTNPLYASSIGLGVSAALAGVMGSRFLKSGKIFPAGVVSLVSVIMTGGYIHGIMRGMH